MCFIYAFFTELKGMIIMTRLTKYEKKHHFYKIER